MKRRNFITSSFLGIGALSVTPTSVFSNTKPYSLENIGPGLNRLSDYANPVFIQSMPDKFVQAYATLIQLLKEKGYTLVEKELTQLSQDCYIVPLKKRNLLGFSDKELLVIMQKNQEYSHYILDEKTTKEYSRFIDNFNQNIVDQNLSLNLTDFAVPSEVVYTKNDKESIFCFKNIFNNTITIKSNAKKAVSIIS